MVMVIAMAAIVVAVGHGFALWALESEFPLSDTVAYPPLLLAVYGGALALFLAWRVNERADGRAAGLWLSLFALNLAVSIVPSQAPSFAQVVVFSLTFAHVVVGLRFTMLFPREIAAADIRRLRDGDRAASRIRPGKAVLRLQELIVSRPNVLWALAAVLVGLWYVRNAYGTAPYSLGLPASNRSDVVRWVTLLLTAPVTFGVMGLAIAFLRSGYRLSGAEERRRTLSE